MPFKLHAPRGGWNLKRKSYADGNGDFGNREEEINRLVKQMI